MNKMIAVLFTGLLSGAVGAAEVVPIDTPCFDTESVVEALVKNKARMVVSSVTPISVGQTLTDSIWYDEDSVIVLRSNNVGKMTCILTEIKHKKD